jgi:hypothetical protein
MACTVASVFLMRCLISKSRSFCCSWARLRSVMSRAIFDAPMALPSESLIEAARLGSVALIQLSDELPETIPNVCRLLFTPDVRG